MGISPVLLLFFHFSLHHWTKHRGMVVFNYSYMLDSTVTTQMMLHCTNSTSHLGLCMFILWQLTM